MKKDKVTGILNRISHIGFGVLVWSLWLLCAVLIVYAVATSFLPAVLVACVGVLPLSSDNMADIVIIGGGCTVCISGLACIFCWKCLTWLFLQAKKFHERLCSSADVPVNVREDKQNMSKKPMSRKKLIAVLLIVFALVAVASWGVPKIIESQRADVDVSEDVDNDILDMDNVEQSSKPLETVADAGLLNSVEEFDQTAWVISDLNPVLDDMEGIVQTVQDAESYATDVQIGFQVDGDMKTFGDQLLTYVGVDITAQDVLSLVGDVTKANGVFYDAGFMRSVSGEMAVWKEANHMSAVDVLYDGAYMYVKGISDNYEGAEGFDYVAQAPTTASDIDVMDSYIGQSGLVWSVMQPSLVNFSVDTDDIVVYTQETAFGTSYMYQATEMLSRGEFDTLTKTVLMECVGDGAYELTIVYNLAKGSESGQLVINVGTDVTDIVVDIPAKEQVYFVTE